MLNIDPRIGVWTNVVYLILLAIAGGTMKFGGLPPATVDIIKDYAFDVSIILGIVNGVFHLFSAPVGGPLSK